MSLWLKALAVAAAAYFVFATGYQLAEAEGEAALKAYQLKAAEARAEQGRKDYARLVDALDTAAASRGELDRARADAERMRRAFDAERRTAGAAAGGAESAELTQCARLLRESVDLLSEGRELVIREAARADALSAVAEK